MELQHIDLSQLKTTKLNVRKIGAKEIDDLVPSIQSLGIIQPLLVRANCEGFEVVAGQRRFHALSKIAESEAVEPVPCIIMQEGDDAKAIEASLAENIARLPMREIDQYKAFSALSKKGTGVEDIAAQFGITDRQVKQRLALGNLYAPILTAYEKQEIGVDTIRSLTLATPKQQKAWWQLFKSDEYAPQFHALKAWLFGGANIPLENALFDVADYKGQIVSDLFGEESYFDDAEKFWTLQNQAIAKLKQGFLDEGWQEVTILDVGEFYYRWDHAETDKDNGGRVYISVSKLGEVSQHVGYVTQKEAKRKQQELSGETPVSKNGELTKSMQNYLALHRHSAVRTELLSHQGIALRLAVAQMIAGSSLWSVQADPQKANTDAIAQSLATNKAESVFQAERGRVQNLLDLSGDAGEPIVPRKTDWGKSPDLYAIVAKLMELDDASVNLVLTFVVAETLPSNSALVEILGEKLSVNMADHWQPDQTFFDLLRDKETLNTIVKQVAGKSAADAHVASTAKVQKQIIQDGLSGKRKNGKQDWQPGYMSFPMTAYTKKGGIEAMDSRKALKKLFK
ncbi:ParB N-terminal domain-containing protein [Pararhizobium sp. IMCC21322]|uniref:ParB/RepB/Spo0J family partition protein n=1 Tax=Pararhizobium sp. IMCC21322 TaxID=3067903 RepID=UPI0027425238|nr:ParB N-terminal domain-containing protein [Pararhizobium sp. IMCC21322]